MMERSALRSFAVGFPRPILAAAAGGGTDFETRSWNRTHTTTTSEGTETWADISGSGMLMAVFTDATGNPIRVQVDGGDIESYSSSTSRARPETMIRHFSTSLKVTSVEALAAGRGCLILLD